MNTIIIKTSNTARAIQKKSRLFQSADSGEIAKSVTDMVLGEVSTFAELSTASTSSSSSRRSPTTTPADHGASGRTAERQPDRPQAEDLAGVGSGRLIIEVTCKIARMAPGSALRHPALRRSARKTIRGHLRRDIDVFMDAGQFSYRPAGELTAARKLA
jgi:hypothetical protein